MISEISALSACELSYAIHARKVSCEEVMNACLARIAQCNPAVNAVVSLRDETQLLEEARQRDRELDAGIDHGWLHGIPQAPKDMGPVRGMRTTKGSPIYKDQVTQTDSIVFERMRKAGAIFVGRTNVPELALGAHTYNPVFGATRNALDPRLTAGGSSGGSAVSVALNMFPVVDGSDQMGSLRIPAAFNHVFGYRPSYGRVPYGPAADGYLHQFSTEGAMARNVPDLAAMIAVQAGYDARSPLSLSEPAAGVLGELDRDFRGVRVAWLGDFQGYLPMEQGLLEHTRSALQTFSDIGCDVQEASLTFSMEELWEAWLDLRSFGVAAAYRSLYRDEKLRPLLKPAVIWEVERGLKLGAMDVAHASEVRTRWLDALNRLFVEFDYALLPASQVYAFDVGLHWPDRIDGREMDTYHRWMEVVLGVTMAGLPALAAPVGVNAKGLAAGIQIIGRPRQDLAVLQLGHAYARARGASPVLWNHG